MEGASVLEPFDLLDLSAMLRVCDVELVLLDGIGPRAAIQQQVHDESLLCTLEIGFTARARFMLPLDWCLIGYIHHIDEAASWCHGAALVPGTIVTLTPDGISEIVLSSGTRVSFALLPYRRLQKKFSELHLGSLDGPGHALALTNSHGKGELGQAYGELDALLAQGHQALGGYDLAALLDCHVREVLAASSFDRIVCARSRRARYLILRRAEDFMRMHLRRHIYIQEICDAAGVSERTLRYAFEDLVGISPNRYLSLLRLCMACRSLSVADSSRKSVKAVALSCGLWDLSRFAESYRRVFGELPRDTLMRRSM
ncbi:transcriptional regulator, AraC family [Pseudoxanthomonas sp. GM95]|uniref:AraC family transcriptional regulator n=1 Tax=Pseudoxanthomonas sp. GM95 TaxID=1881043 RepID=UPI0008AC672F|nr:AraC family transcriptional regulator [Pseudoxanthomonas sp. GM95]SEL68803.1 transcriptional regulator, AraC family [Pseudoxanthomonas sp. GM95]